jgi:hypothetical protein
MIRRFAVASPCEREKMNHWSLMCASAYPCCQRRQTFLNSLFAADLSPFRPTNPLISSCAFMTVAENTDESA